MGMRMPGWFDITDFGGDVTTRKEDVDGILKSVEHLHSIIDEQIKKGVPSERIVVGGFSQGGAIALLVRTHPFLLQVQCSAADRQQPKQKIKIK